MKRVLICLTLVAITLSAFAAKLLFWVAPNALQEAFWKSMVAEYKNVKPDVEIVVEVIPAAASSEEAILTALAAGRAPDFSENIFIGFAAQLVDIGAIIPFDEFGQDFWKLVEIRKMRNIVESWKINGKHYVFPIYSNPMLFWWRGDLLKELGYSKPPRTYSEVYEVSRKFTIPNERYGAQVIAGRNWWDRWFDFIMYYYAASNGKQYIDPVKRRAVYNDEYGMKVTTFIYEMFKNNYTAVDLGSNPFYMGTVLGKVTGPWEINWALETFPKVMEHVWISPPPVPDGFPENAPVYTFADTKGLVIYSHSKYKKEAFEFISWVFSRVESDKKWIEITKMPPAREDLATNPAFEEYMKDRFFKAYAEAVAYAVPPAPIDKTIDVQMAMTNYLIEPLMHLKSDPKEAIDKSVKEINKILF
ncbi:extracellular solute-binding protein [Pseudothermotoga thermarum]|uniref:Carbohydrate ABC transporter substrate-binding protein, CUT1 family n=1 Tax=Pseudothermotoga thermarum DSM 5069 TaxID=688269 RepID=F7YU24_9THEM|nr:extracellular solute-binding protein [Pseudothermotoga thermarum]AEH51609.1 carbohydrate ABC transporter substrate-binding protein, CUT1 family [Pseudothermotoga thermarum DSM 5069]